MHRIETTALQSDRPRLLAEMREVFTPDAFRVVVPMADQRGEGCKVLVTESGAILRDIVDWLDRAGWLA